MYHRFLAPLLLMPILLGVPHASGESLERPAGLAAQVAFWTRIYSEVGTDSGLIHDSRRLDVVYEVLQLPPGLSHRRRERLIEKTKKKYSTALRRLSSGKRTNLNEIEERVLTLWPPGVSNKTLRTAGDRVRFQLGQADKFREGIVRSGRFEPYIRRAFAEHGVPQEIAALPHVESSFNPHAYSHAGAAGLWQFTQSTGRRYMKVGSTIDERFDPFRSTDAAARLLSDNYRETGSWPLAITAYNHGARGMNRAARALGTRDIAEIVERYKSRSFGFASRNFYSELLAAVEVERDAERYFGPLALDRPIEYETVELDNYYRISSLERIFGVDAVGLREHNLALRTPVWRDQQYVPRGFVLRIPPRPGRSPAPILLARIPVEERYASQKRDKFHRVRRGETLSEIARRYGVSQREIVALNNLPSRDRIRIGQKLRLPGDEREIVEFDGSYRVRRGDTLSSIAKRFGIRAADLAAANRISNMNRIQLGQRLRVPEPSTRLAAARPRSPSPKPVAKAPDPPPPVTQNVSDRADDGTQPLQTATTMARTPSPAFTNTPPPILIPMAGEADPDYAPDSNGTIEVEAGETLGHYAEWLGVSAARLRRLNHIRSSSSLVIGQRVQLDFSRTRPEAFETERRAYHDAVEREFFELYRVAGTREHVLRRGDSLWSLSRSNPSVPVWLLRRYNPKTNFGALRPGDTIQIPRLEVVAGESADQT